MAASASAVRLRSRKAHDPLMQFIRAKPDFSHDHEVSASHLRLAACLHVNSTEAPDKSSVGLCGFAPAGTHSHIKLHHFRVYKGT